LVAFIEFPSVFALTSVAEAYASMLQHVSRRDRLGVGGEIRWCANDRWPEIRRHSNGHHVLRDVLPELNARIVAGGCEIDTAVVGRDVELDTWVVTHELPELWAHDRLGSEARTQEPYTSDGRRLQARERGQHTPNVGERRTKLPEQLLPRIGRRDAARRAREQPHPDLLLQPPNRMTQP
jgi:hypothetical protein